MLNADTKKHIDAARDVLVGVAPNPMTQIDQITYALIYKFMDDMDQSAIKAGGEPSFFTGELEPYAWSKLVDTRMGNQEKMNLYGEALQKFAEAKQLPELFRTIFRAAFLPYRSPETLGLFLKEISYFDYTHPEELGNAYEYLLSIMSAQGDAGQFRTPRHIIDFIVDVMDPTKDDKVLDPACGTGGFLVSSYNHILEKHDGLDDAKSIEKPLTPDERKKLMANFEGYDIDPSMVRIAQVNMYLHQFKNPKIFQYDSLTSEERWNDKFDIILANPPFMSPKGGIKPHSKFAIQSNRSEVLFIDYIANHLKPNGRAGIIVPEGIIFQGGKAYKQLRQELVEGGLYAVVSLPSGVFNPYSGVKTSVLLIDKEVAKQHDEILFVKIAADGFDLGANKRPVLENDLPTALELLANWKLGKKLENEISSRVSKIELADTEWNLSADRYLKNALPDSSSYEIVSIEALENASEVQLLRGSNLSKSDLDASGKMQCIHYGELYTRYGVRIDNVHSRTNVQGKVFSERGDVLVPATTTADALGISIGRSLDQDGVIIGGDINVIRTGNKRILGAYLAYLISYPPLKLQLANFAKGTNIIHLSNSDLRLLEFPLPSIPVQEQIISELDGHSAVIDGTKKIVENWKPKVEVDASWPSVTLSEVCEVITKGTTPTSIGFNFQPEGVNFLKVESITNVGEFISEKFAKVSLECHESLKRSQLKAGDVLFSIAGALGRTALVTPDVLPANTNQALAIIRLKPEVQIRPEFLRFMLESQSSRDQLKRMTTGVAQQNLSLSQLGSFTISMPTLETQDIVLSSLRKERERIKSVLEMQAEAENKIITSISRVWSE
jgi:type I restriction enzyme M protein